MEHLPPAASIVIPSSGRPAVVEMTLNALCSQTVPPAHFEVIVVDDGAYPPLSARLLPYATRLQLRSLRRERKGPAAARNAGAALAAAPLLLFLDDDCVPDPLWLESYLTAHARFPDRALAGTIFNGLPENICAEAYHVIFSHLYRHHIVASHATQAPFIISANFGVPTHPFRALGGFDQRFSIAAEDRMFSNDWLAQGRTFHAVDKALVRHHRPLTLRQFLSLQYRYGRGGMVFRKALRQRAHAARPMESGMFYCKLLMTPFRQPMAHNRFAIFVLLVLSQLAIAAGYAAEIPRPPLAARKLGHQLRK